jgi:hypothetical protein
MVEARDGQHNGVVACAFLKVTPCRAMRRLVAGITLMVPRRWSSVMITNTLGLRRAMPVWMLSARVWSWLIESSITKAVTQRAATIPIRLAGSPCRVFHFESIFGAPTGE